MATFASLLANRTLIPVLVPLARHQFHERSIYAYPGCVEWMRMEVPKMVTGRLMSPMTPLEQLHTRLQQWIAGEPMRYEKTFQDLTPTSSYVWEMKTVDLRLFGWMYQRRKFVVLFGDYADDYKHPTKTKTYADARKRVLEARNALPLDGGKFVIGDFNELV